ncbi:geranyltranstransferase [[Clostridium] ultunense Esp]|nr:geranyltranstransferase [[Clostridium] ultunense Esp]
MNPLQEYLEEQASWFTEQLPRFLPRDIPERLLQSMDYSLRAGGKRFRPILLFSVLESIGKSRELGLETAVAIEMIHTYSLIHDDLPGMDNDDYRRGKLTNHKVFGEGMAILAGDALLTWAFYLLSVLPDFHPELSHATSLLLIRKLAEAAGPTGMVGGQALDLEAENKQLPLSELEKIHTHKTGDMIHFSAMAGAILGGATTKQKEAFSTYARKLGLAFQIQDDILNIIGDEQKLGKRVGSDAQLGKSTYPALLGMEESIAYMNRLVDEAKKAIQIDGIKREHLHLLADYIVHRDK